MQIFLASKMVDDCKTDIIENDISRFAKNKLVTIDLF